MARAMVETSHGGEAEEKIRDEDLDAALFNAIKRALHDGPIQEGEVALAFTRPDERAKHVDELDVPVGFDSEDVTQEAMMDIPLGYNHIDHLGAVDELLEKGLINSATAAAMVDRIEGAGTVGAEEDVILWYESMHPPDAERPEAA